MNSDNPSFSVINASPEQAQEALSLFPRLASFELPKGRVPEHLWRGDAELVGKWLEGQIPEAVVQVAVEDDKVLGMAFARLRPELLSQEPSAHLEVLVVAAEAEGRGVGTALTKSIEREVARRGAKSLTLHVFAQNEKARNLYRKMGFDEELLRCTKALS